MVLLLCFSYKKIRYVYLERKGYYFCISKAGTISLEEDFSSSLLLTKAIQEILSKENAAPSKVFITIFRDDVVTHQLNLPQMSRVELEEVILGEVEKTHMFLDKEFDYVYYSSNLGKNRIDTVFTAILKESLDYFIKGVRDVKIPLQSLEIAPLNLLSILYPLGKNEEEQALLVLDEKVSYVIIFFRKEIKFFYITNTGKADLYSHEKEGIDKEALRNWVDEIKRTFKSYLIDNKIIKGDIEKIWFVWDSEGAADLNEILSEKLKQEVVKLSIEAIPNFKYDGAEFNPIYFLCCAPAISYYLRKFNNGFSFEHFMAGEKLKDIIRKTIFVSLFYLILTGIVLGNAVSYFYSKEKNLVNRLNEVNAQISLLEKKTTEFKKERDEYLDVKERLLQQATVLKMFNRVSWSRVFGEISSDFPEELSLTSFTISEAKKVEIKGDTSNIESLSKLLRKVDNSPVLENAKFDFLNEKDVEKEKFFSFGILADLRRDLSEKK